MPLVKSEFRVNLLDYQQHGENMLQYLIKRAGSDMGVKIQEMIPFKKDEEKSTPVYNQYKLELFVTSLEDWRMFKNKLYFALSEASKETQELIGFYLKQLELQTHNENSKQSQYSTYLNNGGTMSMEQWEQDGRWDKSLK